MRKLREAFSEAANIEFRDVPPEEELNWEFSSKFYLEMEKLGLMKRETNVSAGIDER